MQVTFWIILSQIHLNYDHIHGMKKAYQKHTEEHFSLSHYNICEQGMEN